MDPRSLAHRQRVQSVAQQYFGQFRALCTATPARDNHLLQLHICGAVRAPEVVPAYLSAAGFGRARAALDRLQWVQAGVVEHVAGVERGAYDKVHLSNVPDWLAAPDFVRLMGALADKLAPGARLVWRFLHADHTLPEAVRDCLVIDPVLGARLRARDRFPFYDIVPAVRTEVSPPPGACCG